MVIPENLFFFEVLARRKIGRTEILSQGKKDLLDRKSPPQSIVEEVLEEIKFPIPTLPFPDDLTDDGPVNLPFSFTGDRLTAVTTIALSFPIGLSPPYEFYQRNSIRV